MGCKGSRHAPEAPDAVGPVRTLLTSQSQEKLGCAEAEKALEAVLRQRRLQLWVLRAELVRSFETFGKMDPFVIVEHLPKGGTTWEFARTRTDWGGHMAPTFNHLCRSIEVDADDVIRFRLLEKNFGDLRAPTFCGESGATVRQLLRGNVQVSADYAEPCKLKMVKGEEETGFLVVQVGLEDPSKSEAFARVSAKRFESPVAPVPGRSTLFGLKLKEVATGMSRECWVGKDLSRAHSELAFYEQVKKLRVPGSGIGFEPLLEYLLQYEGVVEVHCEGQKPKEPPKQLMVLENPGVRDILGSTYRRVDLKLGHSASTSVTGSRLQQLKQTLMEGLRPGSGDGFCLERFQGGPASLESADPLLDVGGDMLKSEAIRHKARKAMLQRLPGPDVLMYFVDLQKLSSSTPGESAIMAEKLLSQLVFRLAGLAVACRRAPAPQLWLGTSLALSLDTGAGVVPPQATVKLFGWGQANLTTPEQHQALPPAERRERAGKWREFISSIDKVGWEAARAYRHRFNNAAGWTEVKFVVADFDALSNADFIGQVSIHLDKTSSIAGHQQVLHLVDRSGNPVIGKNGLPATLTCAIQFHPLPEGRLSAVWRVHVLSAANLPSRDLSGSSDPWVSLYATGKEGSQAFCFQQRSSVLPRNLDPQWDEMFELPVARPGEQFLAEALEEAAPGLGVAVTQSAEKILPCAVGSGLIAAATGIKEEKAAFSAWSTAAAHAADRAARGLARGGRSPVAPAAGVAEGDGTVEPIFSDGLRSLPDRSACTGWSLLGTCQ